MLTLNVSRNGKRTKILKTGIAEEANIEIKDQSHEPTLYFTKFVLIDSDFSIFQDETFKFSQKKHTLAKMRQSISWTIKTVAESLKSILAIRKK